MPAKPSIDFHYIDPKHAEIHGRLEDWAISCHGPRGSSATPMFRLFRSSYTMVAREALRPIDHLDAKKVGQGVAALPIPHRLSIHWCYIIRNSPKKACQEIGTNLPGLARLIHDGRQMLVNRRV